MKNLLLFFFLFSMTNCKVNQEIVTNTPSPTVTPAKQDSGAIMTKSVKKKTWRAASQSDTMMQKPIIDIYKL